MSLKANIFHEIPAQEVPNKVATEFKKIIDTHQLGNEIYTVISYPAMRGNSTSIIDSSLLRKSISKAKPENVVAVAYISPGKHRN